MYASAFLIVFVASTGGQSAEAVKDKSKGQEYLGQFEVATHGVQGHLYQDTSNGNTLHISRFYYDGEGPDYVQFVLVDAEENDYSKGVPLGILERSGSDELEGAVFNEDLTLVMPPGYGKVKDGDKVVLWCQLYGVSFGRVLVDHSLKSPAQPLKKVGSFIEPEHSVAGDLYIVDESTLEIRNFSYDGQVLLKKQGPAFASCITAEINEEPPNT